MGHNSVVLGYPKSIGIPRVDGLSMGLPDLGCHRDRPWDNSQATTCV